MVTRLSILLSLCCIAFADQVCGAALPSPTVEYSAERSIETEAGTMQGKVYSAKGKERSENDAAGMQTVMILRRDQQLGYMLMPAQKMYQQLDFSKAQQQSGAAPENQVEITVAGSESVEGRDTTKYRMLMKDGSAGGFIWISAEGIALKMDMLSKTDGVKTRITMTLKNLQIAAQDPQLFEVPADYNEMPGVGSFGRAAGQAVTQSAEAQTRSMATEETNKIIAEESAKSIGKRFGFGVLKGALSKLNK